MGKTYGQFCGLARALDHIGDRWTLLVIRELLVDERSYGDLINALDGIPTNLLADRLFELQADGLVTRQPDPRDRRRVTYALTALGRGLEPVVFSLIGWGTHWMRAGPAADRFEPSWMMLALRALLSDRTALVAGTVEIRVNDQCLTVASDGDGVMRVERGAAIEPDASTDGSPQLILGLVSGELTMTQAIRRGLRVRGDRAVASALLQP